MNITITREGATLHLAGLKPGDTLCVDEAMADPPAGYAAQDSLQTRAYLTIEQARDYALHLESTLAELGVALQILLDARIDLDGEELRAVAQAYVAQLAKLPTSPFAPDVSAANLENGAAHASAAHSDLAPEYRGNHVLEEGQRVRPLAAPGHARPTDELRGTVTGVRHQGTEACVTWDGGEEGHTWRPSASLVRVGWVITHVSAQYGYRRLTQPAQGRYVHASRKSAHDVLDAISPSYRERFIENVDTLDVREVDLWDSGDPRRSVFETDA